MLLLDPDQDHTISTAKILATIDQHAESIALILLPGVQYYTGQFLDIPRITAHAHSHGITIGWDLAHAAGNIPLQLHDWGVDFAAWCTYKYMNAGPGAIGGMFVHEKHGKVEYSEDGQASFRHRLTGWYGGDRESRFNMDNSKNPDPNHNHLSSRAMVYFLTLLTIIQSSARFPAQEVSKSQTPPQ
jgi:kynureninase